MKKLNQLTKSFLIGFVLFILCGMTANADTVQVTMTETYGQTQARSILQMVNALRKTDGIWCLDKNGNKDTTTYAGLSELTYDYKLEQVAMLRAMEIALSYSHTRPDNTCCFTAYPSGYNYKAENIAAGYSTPAAVFDGWSEENEDYDGQGHRRNMLSPNFTAIGIGHVVCNGYHYWVQEFGSPASGAAATAANNAKTSVSINLDTSMISSISAALSDGSDSVSLTYGDEIALPDTVLTLQTGDTWPSSSKVHAAYDFTWTVADSSIVSLADGKLKGLKAGSTTLTSSFAGKAVSIKVTVDPLSIASGSVAAISSVVYNGAAQTPAPVLTAGGKTLTAQTDYVVSYSNNVNAGTATVSMTGKGNYTGTKTAQFVIQPIALTDAGVGTVSGTFTYTGSAITPDIAVRGVGNAVLAKDVDYSISYTNNVNAGTASAAITGKGNYTGSISRSFTINKAQNTASVSISGWAYGDSANAPSTTASFGADKAIYTYSNSQEGTYTSAVPSAPGTWYVKSVIPEGDNYLGASALASFVINRDAADKAIGLIKAIGTVDASSACKSRINAARSAYDKLNSAQKALVTNLKVLTAAEKKYAANTKITISKKPTSLKVKVKKNKVTLSWKNVKKTKKTAKILKKIKSIQVEYSTDKKFKKNVVTKKIGKSKTKITLKLKRKTTYYFRVRYKGSNGVSRWSSVKKVKTK